MRFNGIVNNKVLAVFNRCTMARDNFSRRIPLQIREAVNVAVSDVGRQHSFFLFLGTFFPPSFIRDKRRYLSPCG